MMDDGRASTFTADDELKRLYREVAKQVHPDLATNHATRARRTRMMAEANAAHAKADASKLNAMLEGWHSSPEAVDGVGIALAGEEIRRIYQISRRLEELRGSLAALIETPLHRLMDDIRITEAGGRDLLTEMMERLKTDIAATRLRLVHSIAEGHFNGR